MKPLLVLLALLGVCLHAQKPTVYLIPNTHGTVSGWLVDFDTERNWVLNNYLDHMDRINRDPSYRLAYSEVPNLITFLQFAPERLAELKSRIQEGKVELTNGFFLEPDVNLSSGEALVQMGVLGLNWYDKVFGLRPRHCWMIDLTGCHRQMPQIVAGLGMHDLVYCRNNPHHERIYWWESPDGTRVLTLNNRHYAEFGKPDGLFTAPNGLSPQALQKMRDLLAQCQQRTPSRTTLLAIAGDADYSLAPVNPAYPSAFLAQWNRRFHDIDIRFSTLNDYTQALDRELASGQTTLPTYQGDTGYTWEAFWMNMPEVKQYFRRDEHLLAAAELFATSASLRARKPYPAQDFYHSWLNLLMNMDRNTLWGASAGMVFQDPTHWDAWDRFRSVEQQASATLGLTASARPSLYNPLNWRRTDPVEIDLPAGKSPANAACQAQSATRATCLFDLPSTSLTPIALKSGAPASPAAQPLPPVIETGLYTVRIDPKTGAIASLKLRATGEELLTGPGNEIIMEKAGPEHTDPEHFMSSRPKRIRVGSSSDYPAAIQTWSGPLSTIVEVTSALPQNAKVTRRMEFYRHHPRIDFTTRVTLAATNVLVSADFPLAAAERTRAIPYGFATSFAKESVLPAIRWSNYQMKTGNGLALLDQGLTAHEYNPGTLTLVFLNAVAKYMKLPSPILEGLGEHEYRYALVPHTGTWQSAGIPRLAYEFNAPAYVSTGSTPTILETSDNVIVEAVRRVGKQIEVRLYETQGKAGTAEVTLNLPHTKAFLTNLMGENPKPLTSTRFPINPQQIVTLRYDTATSVATPVPPQDWSVLVPPAKQPALKIHLKEKGHPGRL